MRCLHLSRSCASSADNSLSYESFPMLSNHIRFGLTLLLFPGTSFTITLLPTCSSSLNACPYHFNLSTFLYTCLYISPTFAVTLIAEFLILSSLLTPRIHLNILIYEFKTTNMVTYLKLIVLSGVQS